MLPQKLLDALHEEVPAELMEASPLGKIPALREGDFTLSDSSVIIAYLEKSYPGKSLYPKTLIAA